MNDDRWSHYVKIMLLVEQSGWIHSNSGPGFPRTVASTELRGNGADHDPVDEHMNVRTLTASRGPAGR